MGGTRILRSTSPAGLIELSLVSAVATVLVIRLILELSGYPQLGGGGLQFDVGIHGLFLAGCGYQAMALMVRLSR